MRRCQISRQSWGRGPMGGSQYRERQFCCGQFFCVFLRGAKNCGPLEERQFEQSQCLWALRKSTRDACSVQGGLEAQTTTRQSEQFQSWRRQPQKETCTWTEEVLAWLSVTITLIDTGAGRSAFTLLAYRPYIHGRLFSKGWPKSKLSQSWGDKISLVGSVLVKWKMVNTTKAHKLWVVCNMAFDAIMEQDARELLEQRSITTRWQQRY